MFNKLDEHYVFYHDENCYMPEYFCRALEEAKSKANEVLPPMYVVIVESIDFGGSDTVGCFPEMQKAINFMRGWTGYGDILALYRTDQRIGYVDCWDRYMTYTPLA